MSEASGRDLADFLLSNMARNSLSNYIVPGVISSLIGGKTHGKVRVFHATRDAVDFVTPHSHRFNFMAYVVRGDVENTIYSLNPYANTFSGDTWCESVITQVCGEDGINSFTHKRSAESSNWVKRTGTYRTGDLYGMRYDEIHSIRFSKDTVVLFFEGPEVINEARMLEPWVNGKVVPTFKVEDWMFQKVDTP